MRVRYSRRALSQLASVHDYLLHRNQGAAENVIASIRATIGRLRDMPFLGKATDEAGVHVIVEPDYLYRVFYRMRGPEVVVIRILHGRQG
jgi:plasmid stabilization system protein ParE